jgi:hypothetical protein
MDWGIVWTLLCVALPFLLLIVLPIEGAAPRIPVCAMGLPPELDPWLPPGLNCRAAGARFTPLVLRRRGPATPAPAATTSGDPNTRTELGASAPAMKGDAPVTRRSVERRISPRRQPSLRPS